MNGYTHYIFTIAALLLLFACDSSNSDEHEPVMTSAMTFRGNMGSGTGDWATTRGTSVAFPVGEKFGVYACNTGSALWEAAKTTATPNVMCNQMVEKTESGATYTPVRYWVPTQNYSFFAYAPYNATGITLLSGNSAPGVPSLEYEVPQSPASQADLLYASVLDQAETDATTVSFNFKHALVRIRFSAEVTAGASQYTAKVTGIKFNGLKDKGTLSLHTGAWSSISGNSTYTLLDPLSDTDDIPIPYSSTSPEVTLSTPIYIIPQTIANGGEIVIWYEIVSPFEDEPIKRTAIFSQEGITTNSAQALNYHFTIKLTEVGSTLQVENWMEQNDPRDGITSME